MTRHDSTLPGEDLKISVITPSYNSGDQIERAIKSVMAQTYVNWEHLVVDGGSTDGTVAILKRYPHLLWSSEPDNGQADAMNKGFLKSTGDIIVYLNADDYFFENAFEITTQAFKKGAQFVVGNVLIKSERLNAEFLNTPRITLEGMLRHWEPNAFCHNPVGYFYRREIQTICPFNADNYSTMDLEFLLDAAARYEFVKVDHTLGCFMDSLGTKTHTTQLQYDYWQPATFPYLKRHMQQLSLKQRLQYEDDRRIGYAQQQAETNRRRKMEGTPVKGLQEQNTLISVIIPAYNAEKTIARATDSVLQQCIKHIEIIIIDDASTDNTAKVIKDTYSNISSVRYIKHDENKGTGASRNTGIANARGDYIFFLGSDGWFMAEALASLLCVARDTEADIVACGIGKVNDEAIIKDWHAYDFSCCGGIDALFYYSIRYIDSMAANKLYKKSLMLENSICFAEKYSEEDVLFTANILLACRKYVSISDIFVSHCKHIDPIYTEFHLASFFMLWKNLDAFLAKSEILRHEYSQALRERLLSSHGSQELIPKLMHYIVERPCDEQRREIKEACVEVFGIHGDTFADAIMPIFLYIKRGEPCLALDHVILHGNAPQGFRFLLHKLHIKTWGEILNAVCRRLKQKIREVYALVLR